MPSAVMGGTSTGGQSLTKASGADINTGTDDEKYVTSFGIADSYLGDGRVFVSTRRLTNAEIIAGPTVAVEILAAPDAGVLAYLLKVVFTSNIVAPYTHATDAYPVLSYVALSEAAGDEVVDLVSADMADLITTSTSKTGRIVRGINGDSIAGLFTAHSATSLKFFINNETDTGNLEGGNVANYIDVTMTVWPVGA